MAIDEKILTVEPETEIERFLREAAEPTVVVQSGDTRYHITRELPDFRPRDPERVAAAIRGLAGLFTPEEAQRLKAEVYAQRDDDNERRPDR